MKTLSIKQPWAWLLANGHKDVENRNWRTKFRGKIFIHASKSINKQDYAAAKLICDDLGIKLPNIDQLERGGIVGCMTITDCVETLDSPWFFGQYGFTVNNQRACKLHPLKGRLSIYESGVETSELSWRRKK